MVCESSGADVVSPTNTIPAMCVDIFKHRPVLGNMTGGLSGPAIKPVLLNQVYSTVKGVKIPVIGGGGIMNVEDTIEYLLVGAIGIQVGTGVMIKVDIIEELINGILEYLNDRDYNNIYDIIGVI
jgi:dihydroorotate dehydrogenase (NAD+) catalytic subunit